MLIIILIIGITLINMLGQIFCLYNDNINNQYIAYLQKVIQKYQNKDIKDLITLNFITIIILILSLCL